MLSSFRRIGRRFLSPMEKSWISAPTGIKKLMYMALRPMGSDLKPGPRRSDFGPLGARYPKLLWRLSLRHHFASDLSQ